MTTEYGVTLFTARQEYEKKIQELSMIDPRYAQLNNYDIFRDIFNILKQGSLDLLFYRLTKEE
jgi:hypothetical protein